MADIGLDALISALTTTGTTAGASAVGDAAITGAADAALGGGLDLGIGGFGNLAAAGLPFGAGAGELGSVATSAGPLGFMDSLNILSSLGGTDLVAGGLPLGAGLGQVGAVADPSSVADALLGLGASAGTGIDVTPSLAVTAPPEVTTVGPTTPISQPVSLGGASSVTAGTPAGPIQPGSFDVASGLTTSGGPGAPGAVAPVGGVSGATDLSSKAVGAAGSAAPAAGKGFLDTLTESATKNALPAAIAAGGLGYNILQGNKKPVAADAMAGTAGPAKQLGGELAGQGKSLTQYLESGTLPPNMQASLDEAVKSAKTKAISNAAAQGLPTDPTKNTALQQALQKIDQDAITTKAQLGQQLLQSGNQLISTGLNAAGLSNDIYNKLVNLDVAEQKQISEAIANFSKALGGMGSKAGDKSGISISLK